MSSAKRIIELKKDIAASLFIKPATLDELMTRDFIGNVSTSSIDRLVLQLEHAGWVFINGSGKYQTYKHVARKQLSEYELC